MATFNIKDELRRKQTEEPMRSYLWYTLLPNLLLNTNKEPVRQYGTGDGILDAESLYQINQNIHRDLSLRIANISIPFMSVETEKAMRGNTYWYYGKQNDIGNVSFEIYEYEDGLSLKYLQAWQNMMMNSNGTYNSPVVYKNDIKFFRLSSNKEELVVHTYKNYFISGIADISNDYDANEVVRYSVNLTGDSVEHEFIALENLFGFPSKTEQLRNILSIDSVLPDLQKALEGEIENRTGINIPTNIF